MREEDSASAEVTFVRTRRFSGVVQGIPGEWDLELAVCGTPHPLSGMILNLKDIDQIMDGELVASASAGGAISGVIAGVVISDVSVWLDGFEKKVSAQIKRLTSKSESLESGSSARNASFVSAVLDDGTRRYIKRT